MSSPRVGAPSSVSLNALRAFEASARHLSFTKAAEELCVTQAAISHQVKGLEDRIGAQLFRRTSKGLVLTDEGMALAPTLTDSFERMQRLLERFEAGDMREVLTVGVVGTFAVGWLLSRLPEFSAEHPFIDIRLLTNNNKVDLAGESLDCAIQYGDGAWRGVESEKIMDARLAPLCAPATAKELREPGDLANFPLLRSYRAGDWPAWLRVAGVGDIVARGPMFDSSWVMVQAAMQSGGVALAPHAMFQQDIEAGRLVRPFPQEIDAGAYWLTRLMTKTASPAMQTFRDWLLRDQRPSPG